MSKRAKAWGRLARLRLQAELGNRCQDCGWHLNLQFHVVGGEQSHHGKSADARVSFYRRMASQGRVRLLCWSCHMLEHSQSCKH